MEDLIKERIINIVNNKIDDLIVFFQTNGLSDIEIEKKINSELNGFVSTLKYGSKPFSLIDKDISDKENTKNELNEESNKNKQNEENDKNNAKILFVEINDVKPKKRSRTLKTK